MNNIKIISDSSCDLPDSFIKESGIEVIPFLISFETEFIKEGEGITAVDLYRKMLDKPDVFPKTSSPCVQDYAEAFGRHVKEGDPVICICISSKLSGSLNAAEIAKQMCMETNSSAKIEIIDSEMFTVFQGLLVKEALKMRDAGWTVEKIIERANKIKKQGKLLLRIESLKYINKGGRMEGGSGGNGALKLYTVISAKDGSLFPAFTVHGKKAATKKILEKLTEHLVQTELPPDKWSFGLGFGNDEEELPENKKSALKAFGLKEEQLTVGRIGATIAVHTGPLSFAFAALPKAL